MSTHGIDAASGALPEADVPRRGVLGLVQAGLDGINAVMAVLSALAIAVAGLVLTWEVAGRYFFSIPSDWHDELSRARRHRAAGVAADRVRGILADLLSFLFVAFFAWKSITLLLEALEDGQTTPSAWGPPLWIPYGCMSAGMVLLSVQLLLQVLSSRHGDSQPAHLAPSPR